MDDGGCAIETYILEKIDPETLAWVPYGKTADLEAKINLLELGKSMKFRVYAKTAQGESEPMESPAWLVKQPLPPSTPTIGQKDASLTLKWKEPFEDAFPPITGYSIEKKRHVPQK